MTITAIRYFISNPELLTQLYSNIVEYAAIDDEAIAAAYGYTDPDDINAIAHAHQSAEVALLLQENGEKFRKFRGHTKPGTQIPGTPNSGDTTKFRGHKFRGHNTN